MRLHMQEWGVYFLMSAACCPVLAFMAALGIVELSPWLFLGLMVASLAPALIAHRLDMRNLRKEQERRMR